jgi:ABC-type lipoprotein export system ATPase subunit
VIVTHDPSITSYGKRLLRLRDGKIVSDRPVGETGKEA